MTPLVALAFCLFCSAFQRFIHGQPIPLRSRRMSRAGISTKLRFLIRASIALAGWSLLAVIFAAGLGSRLLAGLGLAFFGLTISLIAVDWYLSLEPRYVATAFAAMIAIQQLLAALAFAALIGGPAISGKVAGDLGGLLIATLLGVAYLELMTFVVAWYGDLPDKSAWFLKRAGSGWIAVLVIAILFGAVLPFAHAADQGDPRQPARTAASAARLILFGTTCMSPGCSCQPSMLKPASSRLHAQRSPFWCSSRF